MPGGRPRALDVDRAMPTIVRLFWRAGFARLTLDQVARELGVTKPTLCRALGDKEAIFTKALLAYHRQHIRPGEELLEHAPTLREALAGCFELNVTRMVDEGLPPGCFLTDTTVSGAFTTGPIADTINRLQDRTLALLGKRAAAAIAKGELEASTDVTTVVQYVLGQFAGLSAVSRANPTRPQLEALVTFMLAGLPWATSS